MARNTYRVLILAVLCLLLPFRDASAAHHRHHVLLITSYHQGDGWNDGMVRGVLDILEPLGTVSLAVEYLDVRRRSMQPDYKAAVANFLRVKYRERAPELIIIADDAALDFLIAVRAEMFPGIPVVFCGINNFTPQRIEGQTNITGVNEVVSIRSTMELALRLFPETGRILAVVDEHSAVSRANLEHFRTVAKAFPSGVEIQELLNLTAHEAPRRLPTIPQNSILLRLTTLLEPEGGYMPLDQSMRLISEASPVPVFTVWDFDMGHGALGGILVSSLEQGHVAGKLARDILAQPGAALPPVVMESPNMHMFDYQGMLRFGLSEKDLPADSQVLGKPPSLYAEFKVWFWSALVVILLLSVLVFAQLSYIHYRRRASLALVQSEASLAALLAATPESMLLIDTEGLVLNVNPVAAERIGTVPEALIGQNVYAFLPPENRTVRQEYVRRVVASGEPVHFEDRRAERILYSRLFPVKDSRGRVDRVAIFGSDITEYRSSQEILQRQRDLLLKLSNAQDLFISRQDSHNVFQNMLEVLVQATDSEYGFLDEVLRDADGTPYKLSLALSDISWDEASRRLHAQLVARNLEFRNLDNLSGAPVLDQRVILANNVPAHPRYRGLPDGHPPMSTYLGIPLYFGGEIIGVAGVANRAGGYDEELVSFMEPLTKTCAAMIWAKRIMERERVAKLALQDSEERYRQIVETAKEGIWVLDAEFKTSFVNQRMADMLGCITDEVLGRPRDPFMFVEDIADHETRMQRRTMGTSESYERKFRRKDGSTLWTLVSGTPLLDTQGRIVGSFGMFADITKRKAVEEELRRTSEALHKALAEKDMFFSIIAHDLRSPMTGLLGFVRMFSESARAFSREQLQELAPRLKQSAENLFTLLENLLEWATMQRGASRFEPEDQSLEGVISTNIELARPAADQKDIALHTSVESGLRVHADRQMLNTMLRNLIANAIKFTNPGGTVTVSATQDGDSVQIRVQDDGIGMDREMAVKIFAIDQKTTRAGTRGERSTGLGLILCKEFAEKHGGRIDVESRPGVGSTFTISLPRNRASLPEAGKQSSPSP